ncbi:MAG: hypothetical protein ACF8GE_01140 [Phycisphaerales bacterium JB043]
MSSVKKVVATGGALLVAFQAQGAMVGLEPVSFNSETNAQIASSQIGFDFLDLGVDAVTGLSGFEITITNDGDEDSSVTMVMFDSDIIASINEMDSDFDGVDFGFTNKKVLPGGKPFGFDPTAGLSLRANAPVRPNGVDQGESLVLSISLRDGYSWSDLVNGILDGSTRLGIHVQGFADGGSETFVNEKVLIPSPGALGLLSLAGIASARRRR